MLQVQIVLLDIMRKALLRQCPFAELHYERVPDIRFPEWQVGADEVRGEGVRVGCRRPCSSVSDMFIEHCLPLVAVERAG